MQESLRKVASAARYTVRVLIGLVLIIIFWSCSSVPGVRDETVTPVIRVPFVRVLLTDDRDRVAVGAEGALAIECLDNGQQTVFYSAQDVTVSTRSGRLRLENSGGDIIQEGMGEVNFLPRGTTSHVRLNERRYRGIIKALPYGRNVRLVNIAYLEDYLRGVVPPEIGPREDNELEAIKAQAVAARTYTLAHLQQYGTEPYDMKSTVADQVYEGMEVENRLVNEAIDETVGDVAMFQDDFINAYYHSTCGGMTDDISQVWDKKAQPYLIPVDDSAACSWSKYYVWTEQYTEPQIRTFLEQYLSSEHGRDIKIAPIIGIRVQDRTPGGRVATLEVRTENDVYRFHKDQIRWAIRRASKPDLILASDCFDVDIARDSKDSITQVKIRGRGYGHGVGMCQAGAIGMARLGRKFDGILKRYYTGIDIKKLY